MPLTGSRSRLLDEPSSTEPTGTTKVEVRDTTGRIVLRATAALTLDYIP
jgi:hypothetical protein